MTEQDRNLSYRDVDDREWFTDSEMSQGRPTPTAWRITDALITSIFVATVIAVLFGWMT